MGKTQSLYRGLEGDEIRLLKLDPDGSWSLGYVSLRDAPEYYALSYAWGKGKASTRVDGRRLSITRSLYEALRELQRSIQHSKDSMAFQGAEPGSIRIWIDAICIDQKNTHERNEQVPRMGLIYGSARKVLVWLGPQGDSNERVEIVTSYARQGEQEGSYLKSFQDGAPWTDQQIRDLKDLCIGLPLLTGGRAWFHRLWVIQEVVLAERSPILMIGGYQCSLSSLTDLWMELADLNYPEDFKEGKILATYASELMMYDLLRDWYRSIKTGKSLEEQLSEILIKVGKSLVRGKQNEGSGRLLGGILARTLSDKIVILKGAHLPFLLRATEYDKDSHRYVGTCMVAGELKDEEYGTEFFAHRTVSQFTLV
ncbi:hypothetical protein DL771_012011 [Monosporascus sp. 5C6A]|nr:hypothetical protein DL771_012011 [Monosporascus sp. 5C6A]